MKEKDILKRIYPSVVTYMGDWKEMLKEVKKFKLKEFSLFLTNAGIRQRQNIYKELEKLSLKSIPHVHARHDMKECEYEFLVKKFKTKVFTLHYQYLPKNKNFEFKKKIFIENNFKENRIKNLRKLAGFGGLCLDLSHLIFHKNYYPNLFKTSKKSVEKYKYKVGCNHVSAVLPNKKAEHYLTKISELDYLKEIPKKYFSKYICIELGNSIKEQLKFKKYIAKILVKQWNKKS